jgi:hypothetical protein
VAGIEPAAIPDDVGMLDELNLTGETFTAVGYGVQGFVTGSAMSRAPIVLDSGNRNYKNVSVITRHEASPTASSRSQPARASATPAVRSSEATRWSPSTPGRAACAARLHRSPTGSTPRRLSSSSTRICKTIAL